MIVRNKLEAIRILRARLWQRSDLEAHLDSLTPCARGERLRSTRPVSAVAVDQVLALLERTLGPRSFDVWFTPRGMGYFLFVRMWPPAQESLTVGPLTLAISGQGSPATGRGASRGGQL